MAKLQNRPMNDIIARYQIIKNIKNMEQMNYPEELDDVFLKKIMKVHLMSSKKIKRNPTGIPF